MQSVGVVGRPAEIRARKPMAADEAQGHPSFLWTITTNYSDVELI